MKIFEVFNKGVEWEIDDMATTENGDVYIDFQVGDKAYVVIFSVGFRDDVFGIEFTLEKNGDETVVFNRHNVTNTGDQFIVFATMKDIIEQFVHNKKTAGFTFEAKEPSRVKLYDRIIPIFTKTGYGSVDKRMSGNGLEFRYIVAKDEKTLEDIIEYYD